MDNLVSNEITNNLVNNESSSIKLCKKCKSPISDKRKREFCSDKCAKAFHSLKRYHKIKLTPEYKQKRKEYNLGLLKKKSNDLERSEGKTIKGGEETNGMVC